MNKLDGWIVSESLCSLTVIEFSPESVGTEGWSPGSLRYFLLFRYLGVGCLQFRRLVWKFHGCLHQFDSFSRLLIAESLLIFSFNFSLYEQLSPTKVESWV